MSAYVESPEHIRELAVFAAGSNPTSHDSCRVNPAYLKYQVSDADRNTVEQMQGKPVQELAQFYADVLYNENIRSVKNRYQEDTFDELPGLIEKPRKVVITTGAVYNRRIKNPIHILKMSAGLEYQSCETSNYRETIAYHLLQMIRRAAIEILPGYEDSPYWSYNEETPPNDNESISLSSLM